MKPQDTLLLVFSSLALAAPSTDRGPPQKSAPGFTGGGGSGREGQQGAGGGRLRPGGGNGPPSYPDPSIPPPGDLLGGCEISPLNIEAYCAPPVNLNTSQLSTYVCGDYRLGPLKLPSMIPLDSFVEFYHRFGALCPGEFITKYWDNNAQPTPYWHFPDFEGFSLDTNGDPITGTYTLEVGVLVDRFGGESGKFVSPAAAPYLQRALPPNNLDTPQDNPQIPYGYHLYRVAKTFDVEAGPIAPWFEQPGQGVQYHLPDDQTVKRLVDSGYLVAEDPLELYSVEGDD